MFNLKNYYIYGTSGLNGSRIMNSKIIEILRDGEIKTRESLGLSSAMCNYDNEICLVDPSIKVKGFKRFKYLSAFESFAIRGPSIVLSRDIDNIYRPVIRSRNYDSCKKEHSTDMLDEVRHVGNISLTNLEFITVPLKAPFKLRLYNCDYIERLKDCLPLVKQIEEEFPKVKIRDIYTGIPVTNSEIIERIKKEESQQNKSLIKTLFYY